MATVHLIHGFIGAGKTTFSKRLEKETGAIRFTSDEWMIHFYGSNPPQEFFRVYETNIKDMIWKVAAQLIAKNVDVILDSGFWKRQERDAMRQKIQDVGGTALLYHVQCPDDVRTARALKRTADMPEGALFIDQNALDELYQYFEQVDEDEKALTVLS